MPLPSQVAPSGKAGSAAWVGPSLTDPGSRRALDIAPIARNLAKLLIQKGRSRGARAVADSFAALADEHAGIAKAEITTAVPITDDQRRGIEQQLSQSMGKTVTATTTVDPALIGGLIVRVGDQLVDGSVRTRLRQLRRELTA